MFGRDLTTVLGRNARCGNHGLVVAFIWHCDDRILCSDLGPAEIFHGSAFPLKFARLNFAKSGQLFFKKLC
jgi:hypothetical protein